jgi:hypothetical protein
MDFKQRMKFTLSTNFHPMAMRGLALALVGSSLSSCVVPPPPPRGPLPGPKVAVAVQPGPGPIAVLPPGAVVVRPGVWRCRGVYYRRHPHRPGYVVFHP